MKKKNQENRELEVALVKIARALFNYADSQTNFEELGRLDPIFDNFENLANDYHNDTGRLHPDLGFELNEWAAFKSEFYDPDHPVRVREGKSGLTKNFVEKEAREVPLEIIERLEKELGINKHE